MITAAFRLLKLGPVVGQRTWGGVVGMTGRHRLGDGTVITVPMNAAWFDTYGWSVENHGVEPDLEALRTPLDWAEGRHAVLDDGVRVALDLLAAHSCGDASDVRHGPGQEAAAASAEVGGGAVSFEIRAPRFRIRAPIPEPRAPKGAVHSFVGT